MSRNHIFTCVGEKRRTAGNGLGWHLRFCSSRVFGITRKFVNPSLRIILRIRLLVYSCKLSVRIVWKGLFMKHPCGTPRMNLCSLVALGSLASDDTSSYLKNVYSN